MSTFTESYSQTYTSADVGKVIDHFAADLDMIAQVTELWTRSYAREVAEDIKLMAQNGYLKEVNICLLDADGYPVRATKYNPSTDGSLTTSNRPGNNMWPKIAGTILRVVVVETRAWPSSFANKLKHGWGYTNINTAFPHLTCRKDRDYVSNGYGLSKSIYS
jgi:Bacterial HORMA domain family 1